MTHSTQPHPSPSGRAFTLLELLVVLAILAVIATGIATTYGRKNIDEAKDKMTLHEMHEIKKAFRQFEMDNYRRLREDLSDHTGATLPTVDYFNFGTGHVDDDQLEAWMQFYETYGLWFLFQPKIPHLSEVMLDSDGEYRFPVFDTYNPAASEGWNGPYIEDNIREAWSYDGIPFPQIADKHGGVAINDSGLVKSLGVYRLLYYEHREGIDINRDIIYRRLLLVAPRGNTQRDELTDDELLLETGNLRGGPDEGRLNLSTGTFENHEDSPFFLLELKNMDILP